MDTIEAALRSAEHAPEPSDSEAMWLLGLVEVEISTDLADAPADVFAEIVTAYVDPWELPGCP